jgi:hypothetical protein
MKKKVKKQKVDSGRKSKVSEKKVCFFVTKRTFSFFSNTHLAWQIAIFAPKMLNFFKSLKICIPMGEHI